MATVTACLQSDGYEWVISLKYGILLLGQKSCIQDIKVRVYWLSKSIPQNLKIFDIWGTQKPTGAKFWEFDFFISKDKVIQILPEQILTCGHIIFIHKSYIEIVDKIIYYSKNQAKVKFHIFLRSSILLLLQVDPYSFQAS